MIERYTIKFGPVVSQKEIGKALNDPTINGQADGSRIEMIGDFEDIKRISALLKELSPRM